MRKAWCGARAAARAARRGARPRRREEEDKRPGAGDGIRRHAVTSRMPHATAGSGYVT